MLEIIFMPHERDWSIRSGIKTLCTNVSPLHFAYAALRMKKGRKWEQGVGHLYSIHETITAVL